MIPENFRPNLAANLTKPELIRFPVYVSPKIDGIRCTVFDGVAYSRTMKPIPNEFVQGWAKHFGDRLEGLDGELVVGDATAPNCMQNSMAVMRKSGQPDFSFHVFDQAHGDSKFGHRLGNLVIWFRDNVIPRAALVQQVLAHAPWKLHALEEACLSIGYEGAMIRRPDSLYKFGRSTEREGGLVKVKRFSDAEAEVIGFEEEMHNGNVAKLDAFGRTERSSVRENLVPKDALGALIVRSGDGTVFNIGTGFTDAQRADYWARRAELMGQLVTYKFFAHGVKDAPRHPVFKSFRSREDV